MLLKNTKNELIKLFSDTTKIVESIIKDYTSTNCIITPKFTYNENGNMKIEYINGYVYFVKNIEDVKYILQFEELYIKSEMEDNSKFNIDWKQPFNLNIVISIKNNDNNKIVIKQDFIEYNKKYKLAENIKNKIQEVIYKYEPSKRDLLNYLLSLDEIYTDMTNDNKSFQ